MKYEVVGRRKALKYLSMLAASAAGQEFLASWLPAAAIPGMVPPGVKAVQAGAPTASAAPQFFTPQEYRDVEILTELIIPTDDTPGAKEAQVARYIDFVVFSAAEFEPQMQKEWTEGLALVNRLSRQKHGHAFSELSSPRQESLLTELSLPEHDPRASHEGFGFYRQVKEMTVDAFYSSKIGLTDVLGYLGRQYCDSFPGCSHPEHQP